MQKSINLGLPDSEIQYYPGFLKAKQATELFEYLQTRIPWTQDSVRVFGKWYPQPRLTALTSLNQKPYSYSGLTLNPLPMPEALISLKKMIEPLAGAEFSSCLLNLYRDGSDSNGWHADDEKELGRNPVIASVSLGADRMFHFRHRKDHNLKHKLILENGSLLIMAGATQHYWHHQLPKTKKNVGARINLTYRKIQ